MPQSIPSNLPEAGFEVMPHQAVYEPPHPLPNQQPQINHPTPRAEQTKENQKGFLKDVKGSVKHFVQKCKSKKEAKAKTPDMQTPAPIVQPVVGGEPQQEAPQRPPVPFSYPTAPYNQSNASQVESGNTTSSNQFKYPEATPAQMAAHEGRKASDPCMDHGYQPSVSQREYMQSSREWDQEHRPEYRESGWDWEREYERRYGHSRSRRVEPFDFEDEYDDYPEDYYHDVYHRGGQGYGYHDREVRGIPRPPPPPPRMSRSEMSAHLEQYMPREPAYAPQVEMNYLPPFQPAYTMAPAVPFVQTTHYLPGDFPYSGSSVAPVASFAPSGPSTYSMPSHQQTPFWESAMSNELVPHSGPQNYSQHHQPQSNSKSMGWAADAPYSMPHEQRQMYSDPMAFQMATNGPEMGWNNEMAGMQRRLSMPMAM